MILVATTAQAQGPTETIPVPVDTGSVPDPSSLPTQTDGLPVDPNNPPDPTGAADIDPSNPGPGCTQTVQQAAGQADCDTKYTPTFADGTEIGWRQVTGAIHPDTPSSSRPTAAEGYQADATPVTVDFYTVDFLDQETGLAAGAQCVEDLDPNLTDQQLTDFLRTCPREPVIYRYSQPPGEFARWERVDLGQVPGFVGAVTWLDDTGSRALAVGGTGCYPRREELCPNRTQAHPVPAPGSSDPITGNARVWLYSEGTWEELEPPRQGEVAAGGMIAIASTLRTADCSSNQECAFAGGGLAPTGPGGARQPQIWMWLDGHWRDKPYAATLADGTKDPEVGSGSGVADWRYRVRDIRFSPAAPGFNTPTGAAAVTGGCPQDRTDACSRLLEFRPLGGQPFWGVSAPVDSNDGSPAFPDSLYSAVFAGKNSIPNNSINSRVARTVSLLLTPGGPAATAEAPSRIINSGAPFAPGTDSDNSGSAQSNEAVNPTLAPIRLVAGDGDLQGHRKNVTQESGLLGGDPGRNPDGFMDWAVGGFKPTEQAIAYTTTEGTHGADAPYPITCPVPQDQNAATRAPTDCQPDSAAAGRLESHGWYSLTSYFLNDFAMLSESGDGWAVGDRGAIMRLAGDAALGTLPPEDAPRLGPHQPSPSLGNDAYQGRTPPMTSEPGRVPALATQPAEDLPGRRWVATGSPDPVIDLPERISSVVMSRDGADGWAVGPTLDGGPTTLYHFDGAGWRSCRSRSVSGALDADPACASLLSLRNANGGTGQPITALARIPMEYGSDPTAAAEFELVAAASNPNRLLRYKDGEWSVDETGSGQISATTLPISGIAFSGPADGWLVSNDIGGTGNDFAIFHFDGSGWAQCASNSQHWVTVDCRDGSNLIPVNGDASGVEGDIHLSSTGGRVYLYGNRAPEAGGTKFEIPGLTPKGGVRTGTDPTFPLILYLEPGPEERWQQAYDPGCATRSLTSGWCVPTEDRSKQGVLDDLSVALNADGRTYNGWAVGEFRGPPRVPLVAHYKPYDTDDETPFLRAGSDGLSWEPVGASDVARDYLLRRTVRETRFSPNGGEGHVLALASDGRPGEAVAVPSPNGAHNAPMLRFDPVGEEWKLLSTPFEMVEGGDTFQQATAGTMAPDNMGGFWLDAQSALGAHWFYHYTDRAPKPLFEDVAHPIREQITAAAAGTDGTFWVATDSEFVYRYDRIAGWDRIPIPGWDPGRVRTVSSPAYAVAGGPDGHGLVVGKNGRIADIGPGGAVLDVAAGVLCRDSGPPCGTGRDLHAAAVGPQGSALVGGDFRSLLWRPAGGEFQSINPPPMHIAGRITGISMPTDEIAWLSTSGGEIYRGQPSGSTWTWTPEVAGKSGNLATRQLTGGGLTLEAVNGIAVDRSGHGYAVGDNGMIAERTGGTWHRVDAGYLADLVSITLSPDGNGALIGGLNGLILTETTPGEFAPARPSDLYDPANFNGEEEHGARPVGAALIPGYQGGQIEAWAAFQAPERGFGNRPPHGGILHFSSDPSEPLLDGGTGRARALPDAPVLSEGELSFAALGNSNCQGGQAGNTSQICPEITGSNKANEIVALRVRDELAAQPGGTDFALFSGDVGDIAGQRTNVGFNDGLSPSVIHKRWEELVPKPLLQAGTPLFGAIGGRDLVSEMYACAPFSLPCTPQARTAGQAQAMRIGPNRAWREAMAEMAPPWGAPFDSRLDSDRIACAPPPPDSGGVVAEAQKDPHDSEGLANVAQAGAQRAAGDGSASGACAADTATQIAGPTLEPGQPNSGEPATSASGLTFTPVADSAPRTIEGGARTHYAFDVQRYGQSLLRVVVLDTSLKSLAASDAQQNPVEDQLGWLRDVLGSRPAGERAVVVSNTPTYSYGPGAGTDTLADGTVLEQVLMQNHVDLVVSGRLGFNGLYWTCAPGLHFPQAGSSYPDPAKPPSGSSCAATSQTGNPSADDLAHKAQDTVLGAGGIGGALPTVIAHTAGGKFGPDGSATGEAKDGFWRGYTMIRMDPTSGQISVEQRPVFDWIGVRAITHALRPGQKIKIIGFGREAAGIDVPFRYDAIDGPAITHRYDLLYAQPDKPWLAGRDDAPPAGVAADGSDHCGNYICIPSDVGQIDPQTGQLRAGSGKHERIYAIALLSVDDETAQWPLALEPRASFKPKQPKPALPKPTVSVAPQPPEPPTIPNPTLPTLNLPPTPPPPILPVPGVPPTATPTAPPPPPPPALSSPPAPLALSFAPTGLTLAPQSTVVPPPAPPIQPAPPGGARKEARQRQAAAAKSEEGSPDERAGEAQDLGGDSAEGRAGPDGTAMTRHENTATRLESRKPEPSYTLSADRSQPSAWTRGALYGGGAALMALVLALGFSRGRPTPRRREPELPAPAWSKSRRRH